MKFLSTTYNSFQGKVYGLNYAGTNSQYLNIFVDFSISEYSFIKDRGFYIIERKSNNFAGNVNYVPWLGASDHLALMKGNLQRNSVEGGKTFRAKEKNGLISY